MKKLLFVVALTVSFGVGYIHAQQSDPIDLVVLVDTSESMLPYWQDTTDYIIKNIVTGVLHKGDTFHLISFASHPELEISKRIETQQDVKNILARFLLLQPLGRYTDLVAAIQYLYQYVIDLPLATQKRIIILTDGIDDPPPDSSFPLRFGPNGQDLSGNKQIIIDTAQAMRQHGWEVHIIQYPIAGSVPASSVPKQPGAQLLGGNGAQAGTGEAGKTPSGSAQAARGGASAGQAQGQTSGQGSSGQTSGGQAAAGEAPGGGAGGQGVGSGSGAAGSGETGLLNDLSKTLGVPIQQFEGGSKQNLANIATGSPSITFPKNLGNIGYETTAPFVIRNFEDQPILVQLTGIVYDGVNILRHPVNQPVGAKKQATLKAPLRLPVSLSPGAHTIDVELQFADSLRVSPHAGRLAFTLRKGLIEAQGISFYALPVLFGLIFVAVIVLIIIFIRRIVAGLGAAPSASIAPRVRFDGANGAINPIELRVSGQNPNIGGRNIHPVGSGSRRTVGGGGSAFLIYLYPCPAHIGEIVSVGESYSFVPSRPEYFPDLSGELNDCLGKPIRVRTSEGHEVTITFRRYVSPLEEVNRIMHLIDKPGTPGAST